MGLTSFRWKRPRISSVAFLITFGVFFLWFVYSGQMRIRLSIAEVTTYTYQTKETLLSTECVGQHVNWSNPHYSSSHSSLGKNETMNNVNYFNFSAADLASFGIPLTNFTLLKRHAIDRFVFVTAANGDYFHIAMDAIGNVQRHFPNQSIYFYDLDENRPQDQIIKIKNICNVIYRVFNYCRYPSHVRQLKLYSFKPIVVHEMLMEFPGVFWIDSSIRFNKDNLSAVYDQIYENNGILAFARSYHSNFAATHPGMYRFFPIAASAASTTEQRDANSIFFYRTEEVYMRIVVWWVLCALREDCMAAGRQLVCNFNGKDVWAGCHRFDQSAINILMARHFQYDDLKYLSRDAVLTVKRGSAHREFLEVCSPRKRIKSAEYFS